MIADFVVIRELRLPYEDKITHIQKNKTFKIGTIFKCNTSDYVGTYMKFKTKGFNVSLDKFKVSYYLKEKTKK
jgi:hypothetical protein